MIKGWIRNFWRKFLGIDKLEEKCAKADIANENGITFLLNNTKINTKGLFEPYRHKPFEYMPYYLRVLFENKYHIKKEYISWARGDKYSLFVKSKRVGFNDSHLVEIYENIKKANSEVCN